MKLSLLNEHMKNYEYFVIWKLSQANIIIATLIIIAENSFSRTSPYGHLSNTDSSLGPGKMPIHSL